MINAVRKTVLFILNKDNNGYMTPDEFNMYAKQAQLELYEQYQYDYSRAVSKRNSRDHNTGFGDIPKQIEEVMGSFYVTKSLPYSNVVSPPKFILPNDAYKSEDLMYNLTTPVDIVTAGTVNKTSQLLDAAPSTDYPVAVIYDNDDTVTTFTPEFDESKKAVVVYPLTIQNNVTLGYYRYPKDPKWTYTSLAGGEPIFDQSSPSYQDFELPVDDMENLVEMILGYAGVSIRDYSITEIANQYYNSDKQTEQ